MCRSTKQQMVMDPKLTVRTLRKVLYYTCECNKLCYSDLSTVAQCFSPSLDVFCNRKQFQYNVAGAEFTTTVNIRELLSLFENKYDSKSEFRHQQK